MISDISESIEIFAFNALLYDVVYVQECIHPAPVHDQTIAKEVKYILSKIKNPLSVPCKLTYDAAGAACHRS